MFDCLAHILWQFIASISLFSEASSQYFRCLLMKDHLFMFKTTIMVNIREKKIYCIIPTNAILFLYFFNFNPFLLLFSSFFPIFFVLILWYLSRMCRTFSPLLDIFLSGTFFPGGGGGARAPSVPPSVHAWIPWNMQRVACIFCVHMYKSLWVNVYTKKIQVISGMFRGIQR